MSQHNVRILVTVPRPELLDNCTLVFDTLRVGFPNAFVTVDGNNLSGNVRDKVRALCAKIDCQYSDLDLTINHHANWICDVVHSELYTKNVVIVDPDIIFFRSIEDWQFDTPLAGYHTPAIWNEFAQCPSYERFHTSLLWIRDCEELRKRIAQAYPPAWMAHGEYCPIEPFYPQVVMAYGQPAFYDTTSMLFHMIGGTAFEEKHRKCYAHVNSSAFYDVMLERTEDKEAFILQHKKAKERDYEWFREWYKAEDAYYLKMNEKLQHMQTRKQ